MDQINIGHQCGRREELLRDMFVFALFICSLCPFIPSLLLSLSGCRLNLCLFIGAAAELNYGSVCWGGGGAPVAAWHITARSADFTAEMQVVGGQRWWWGREIREEAQFLRRNYQMQLSDVHTPPHSLYCVLTEGKGLGGAESRSVGDSVSPDPQSAESPENKSYRGRFGITTA